MVKEGTATHPNAHPGVPPPTHRPAYLVKEKSNVGKTNESLCARVDGRLLLKEAEERKEECGLLLLLLLLHTVVEASLVAAKRMHRAEDGLCGVWGNG